MRHLTILITALALFCGCVSIQSKYAKTSTPELQLRRNQCVQFLNAEKKGMEFKFGSPIAMAMMGDGGRQDRINEMEEIEKELLRRYQAGDQTAYLPVFGR